MTETQTPETDQEADGDEGRAASHNFEIIVNGRKKVVDHWVLNFEEVVRLAGYSTSTDPNVFSPSAIISAISPGLVMSAGE